MSPLFASGDWVIDTRKNIAPTVVAVINAPETVYVLEDHDDNLYLERESNLIEYDKYYFDKK